MCNIDHLNFFTLTHLCASTTPPVAVMNIRSVLHQRRVPKKIDKFVLWTNLPSLSKGQSFPFPFPKLIFHERECDCNVIRVELTQCVQTASLPRAVKATFSFISEIIDMVVHICLLYLKYLIGHFIFV